MDFITTFLYSIIGVPIILIVVIYLKHLIKKFNIEEHFYDLITTIILFIMDKNDKKNT